MDSGNGCLRYYPHSHRLGLLPHEGGGPRGFSQRIGDRTAASALGADEAVALEPGDAVLHDGLTAHRAEANRSVGRHRRALGVVYRAVASEPG